MTSLPISPPPIPRSPWQRFYAAGHGLRQRYWSSRAAHLPKPVLSIGNLSWGGSGKTPMTAAVAEYLRDSGRRVAILSRGYGATKGGQGVRIVSRGEGPLLGPRMGGDEPVLLAGILPGVSVIVCPDRALAGRHALERLDQPPDVFLLDDGFSHLSLVRDLDILLFPSDDPFAGGRLPPAGRLREPLSSARRAQAAILTSHRGDPEAGEQLARALRPHGFSGAGFTAAVESQEVRPYLPADASLAVGSRVLVVAAIARPERLVETVREKGLEIADQLTFPDHHPYPEESLAKIAESFDDSGAEWIVTTSKDMVKLQGRLERPLAELPIRAKPEKEFFHWLERRLSAIESAAHPASS